jgi:hypothetical protein
MVFHPAQTKPTPESEAASLNPSPRYQIFDTFFPVLRHSSTAPTGLI